MLSRWLYVSSALTTNTLSAVFPLAAKMEDVYGKHGFTKAVISVILESRYAGLRAGV